MTPTTEVIICTYNGAPFILEQLRTILAQTARVDKISIYDDRSLDDTIARVQAFIDGLTPDERASFNVHVNPRNLGFARNFMAGVGAATEDILFLCDQDD